MTIAGMDLEKLRKRLGHANAATTEVYRQAATQENHDLQMQYHAKAGDV